VAAEFVSTRPIVAEAACKENFSSLADGSNSVNNHTTAAFDPQSTLCQKD
jgi:hypothetical protein